MNVIPSSTISTGRLGLTFLIIAASSCVLFSGCATAAEQNGAPPVTRLGEPDYLAPATRYSPPATANPNSTNAASVLIDPDAIPARSFDRCRAGDELSVTFSDLPAPGLPEFKERIKDDGYITLPLNIRVLAEGKTTDELARNIQSAYVPRYYKYLTVNVKGEDRIYFVGGEVRSPDRRQYVGAITVTQAIVTAGGFTDFANRKKVQLLRYGNDKPLIIDFNKALQNRKLDLPIYPGDTIIVPKRGVFN
jgi:polysaccharide export outer membrane protein